MSDSKRHDLERAIDREVDELQQHGFTQQQWRALINVLALAKEHPAFDEDEAGVILERIEARFAKVRDTVVEENRRKEEE